MIGLIGRKVGMTQIFDDKGNVVPVTVIEAGPCTVTEVRTDARDGYQAVQVGFGTNKESRFRRPVLGQFKKRNLPPSRHVKEFRVDAKVYTYVVGMKYPMPGICGGQPGEPNKLTIRYESDDPFVVKHTADWIPMAAGQKLNYDYGGGGGWGDPLDREPQAVLDDVLDEYVSLEGAARDYGVVLTGSLDDLTLAVDQEATDRLRASRR